MHTPMEVTKDALARATELKVDCCVHDSPLARSGSKYLLTCFPCQISVGGGSTIGLGKALALHSPDDAKIKNIVIPTTCALRRQNDEINR